MRSSRRTVRTTLAVVLAAAVLEAGCTSSPRPVTPAPLTPPASAVQALQHELAAIFHAPVHDHAAWAVVVQSLDSGETLYALNPSKLMMPASNMKILTLAAAALRLGWDFRFETRLIATGPVHDGVLHGDLVIVGTGDPSIGGRDGPPARTFEAWAAALADQGIRRIDGRLVGDDRAFEEPGIGAGWAWDYLAWGYAAPTGALQYNEDAVLLTVRAAASASGPVCVDVAPEGSGLELRNGLETVAPDGAFSFDVFRLPGSNLLEIRGTVPAGTPPFSRAISVDSPTRFFVSALAAALTAQGIELTGPALGIRELDPDDPAVLPPPETDHPVLLTHRSPPLSELGAVLMKVSQNLYADSLLKRLGHGNVERGRETVREALSSLGVPPTETILYDGSGLSRYNYVTAEAIATVLRRMWRDPSHVEPFAATFPVAGREGTVSRRLLGTRAEGNARAKTGSISNVRSLSGYVETLDGETLAFAILANHFRVPQASIDDAIDLAVERLAGFSR